MAISSPGIGSGLDVNSIVSQLMTVEKQPLTQLDQKEAGYQAQLSALGSVKSALSQFQSAVAGLDTQSPFQSRKGTTSDPTVLTAGISAASVAGTYNVQVSQLAQAQALVAAGQSSTTTAIGNGASTTLTFQFGRISGGTLTNGIYSGATFTQDATVASGSVTIDSTNNTLAGIRDAINQAALDVTASIVGDGSATPYRLVLQSSATGASSAMRISVAGDPALQALLGYDASGTQNLTQTVVAQDASLTINGVAVTSAGNSVSSALDGVTLNLLKPGSSALTVGQDTSAAQNAVQAFVKAYNDLSSTLSDLSKYDPTTKQAGLLNGDSAVRSIQVQLRNVLGSALGTSLSYSTLSQLGLSFQRDGSLSLDTTKLQSALASDADSVAALFTTFGNTTDSLVHYVGQGDTTPPGQYNVSVSALATQGTLVGSTAAGLSIDASNDQIAVNLDGLTATIQLPDGTYTSDQLATLLQSAINGAATFRDAGSSVKVAQSGGVLSISSARYGSASQVSIGGAGAASLLGGAPVATAGTDVAGTIDGSAASGSGQTLTSATGLKIAISGGATGSRGSVTVTRGIATQLNTLLTQLLGSTGPISAETDGINRSIQDIDSRRDTLNQRLTDIEQRYRTQFTQLDTLLSNMTATSNFLTQQLAALNKSNG